MATAKKRTLIEPNPGDKRFVRRNEQGEFKESDDVGRSLSADVKRAAKTAAPSGQGDKGDRKATGARKTAAKKTSARKTAAKKAPARKTAAKKAPAKKTGAKKTGAKTAARKTAGRETAARQR
jgi:hypothetical protein